MKKTLMKLAVVLLCMTCSVPAMAQFNLKKAVGGAVKAAKAVTLTDEHTHAQTKYGRGYRSIAPKPCPFRMPAPQKSCPVEDNDIFQIRNPCRRKPTRKSGRD